MTHCGLPSEGSSSPALCQCVISCTCSWVVVNTERVYWSQSAGVCGMHDITSHSSVVIVTVEMVGPDIVV